MSWWTARKCKKPDSQASARAEPFAVSQPASKEVRVGRRHDILRRLLDALFMTI